MPKKYQTYQIDGVQVPSVTTILRDAVPKPQLHEWIGRVGREKAEEIRNAAGRFGDQMHSLIEAYASGQKVEPPDTHEIQLANFETWASRHIRKWHHFEVAAYSRKHSYAGTIDAIATLSTGELALVDFKTSKAIRPEYYLQVAAYRYADYCSDPSVSLDKLQTCIIVHLDRKTKLWEHVYAGEYEDFLTFLAFRKAYAWLEKIGATQA